MFPAFLSPDGGWVYTFQDEQGNEIGHYVRIPYEGGEVQDITPALPPYLSFAFSISRAGNRCGFMAAGRAGFTIYLIEAGPQGSLGHPAPFYRSESFSFGPIFSADGEIAMVMTSEPGERNLFCLKAFRARTGEAIAELREVE